MVFNNGVFSDPVECGHGVSLGVRVKRAFRKRKPSPARLFRGGLGWSPAFRRLCLSIATKVATTLYKISPECD